MLLLVRRSGGLRVAGALCAPLARNVRGRARRDDLVVVRVSKQICDRRSSKGNAALVAFQLILFDN